MIPKKYDKIEKVDLDSLVANQVKESRTLEYKLELPGGKDGERKEFLADVASFANAAGGDLLYGVDEERDAAGKPTGIPKDVPGLAAGTNVDAEIRRLESMIAAGIGPRIAGIQTRAVSGFSGPVLLMRIPQSFGRPHMITFQEWSRFYSRNSSGKYPLDITELRSAFALSETLPQRIRNFRDDRLARIVAGDTPLFLGEGPKLVLHVVPIAALIGSSPSIDIQRLEKEFRGFSLPCFDVTSHSCRFNLDGLLSYDIRATDESGVAYAQAFRDGSVEFADVWRLGAAVPMGLLPVTLSRKFWTTQPHSWSWRSISWRACCSGVMAVAQAIR